MEYGGSPELDPPAPEDEDNIMALVLEQSDRVTSISRTITRSLLKRLSAIEFPLLELENLNLLYGSPFSASVTLPRTFRWGPRFSCLRLSRINFPTFLPLLYASRNVVYLQLQDVLDPWPISPEEFTDVLSCMAQLRSLSLHLPFTADSNSSFPQTRKRVLRALNRLKFQGTTKYLEQHVARIDAPRLRDIEITSLNDNVFGLPNLGQFIDRVKPHKSHHQAHILSSEYGISITFTRTGAPTCLRLKLLCKSLHVQLYSMARICIHFSALLLNVEDLRISVGRKSRGGGRLYGRAWLELIASFSSVKWFHASKDLLTLTLQSPHKQRYAVLPVLHKLYISQPGSPHAPLMDEMVSLMISRWLFGRPIAVEYEKQYNVNELSTELCEPGTIYAGSHCDYLLTCLE